jgi:uncharacterized protein (DUF433 family)
MNIPVQHVEIVDGQPVVGTQNVKVKMVVNMYLRGDAGLNAVMEHYNLNAAEIYAALAYYYDNQTEFDRQYHDDVKLLKRVGQAADEHLAHLRTRQGKT